MLLGAHAAAGSSWTPADLGNLWGWYDATVGVTDAGSGAVSQWADQSGNGHHFTQGTAGSRPTTGTHTLNSLNVIAFDGSSDFLEYTASPTVWQDYIGWAAVFIKTGAPVGFEAGPLTATYGNSGRPLDVWGSSRYVGTSAYGSGWTDISSQTSACVLLFEGDRVGSTWAERKDGASVTSSSDAGIGSGWSTTSQILTMASRDDNATYFRGDIAEIVVWDGSAISGSDRTSLEGYLKAKWGTP